MKKDPYVDIEFERKHIVIKDKDGNIVLDEMVEFPKDWEYNNCRIITEKYLCNRAKVNKRELSIKNMFDRVSDTITKWGKEFGYFDNDEDAEEFNYKLKYYQIHQYFAFNSPVYFNVGDRDNPQASACFILSMEDDMDSITNIFHIEGRIFKQGSGSGINYSTLRSSKERVGEAGYASGPVSFLKAHDTFAGVVKSGGRLRRSARMAVLSVDHPDIFEWIECKRFEEDKMKALITSEIVDPNDIRYMDEVYFQNTNLSVRIPNKFMEAVINDDEWELKYVTTGEVYKKVKARDILRKIAESVWRSGEPGVQFDDIINDENPCKNTVRINASNPCSEYMFCDNSSCNLASLNLLKFYDPINKSFDIETFADVISVVITAQDIIVDGASYPTKEIEKNSKEYRALGLGYTNLGGLLMRMGIPYNSKDGRAVARAITALMQANAIKVSAKLAQKLGPYKYFNENKDSHYEVLHRQFDILIEYYGKIKANKTPNTLVLSILDEAIRLYNTYVVTADDNFIQFIQRNAQLTLLAPTGTISFIMGAETTGIEPDYSIIKYKTLSDTGDIIQIVNKLVEPTLKDLGFSNQDVSEIIKQFKLGKTASEIKQLGKYAPIFYDAREISYIDHLLMMAAVQPFLSGSISKTINVPSNITIDELMDIYIYAWKLKLKSVIIYRDQSKNFQVLSDNVTKDNENNDEQYNTNIDNIMNDYNITIRRKLPSDVEGGRHKFRIGTFKGYLNYSIFPGTNELAEFFITASKQGSTISGLLDALATTTSIALQYGLPLKVWIEKMLYQKFEPAGFTSNKDIKFATSIVDYIAKYFGKKFLTRQEQLEIGLISPDEYYSNTSEKTVDEDLVENDQSKTDNEHIRFSGSICPNCGSMMRRLGTCDFCDNCGFNSGSCS